MEPFAPGSASEQIAIVVPVYNGARFLQATLESVFAQCGADWQLVVVDDGSTDDTAEVALSCLKCDTRAKLVRQPNGGLPAARNRGYAEITPTCGKVMFLDANDLLHPDALAMLA